MFPKIHKKMTKQSHQCPFSNCVGAFDHITQIFLVDGICPVLMEFYIYIYIY